MRKIVVDIVATGLSVLVLQLFFAFAKTEGQVNWELIIFDLTVGVLSYWILLILFRGKSRLFSVKGTVCVVILGSTFWALLHAIYLIHFDWKYLSNIRPEGLHDRSIETVKTSLLYFVPLYSVFTLFFIFSIRYLEKYLGRTEFDGD